MSIIGRLFGNRRKLTNFFKTRRRQLPTGITVDAGRIDKEITGDIVQGLPRVEELLEARKKKKVSKIFQTEKGSVI